MQSCAIEVQAGATYLGFIGKTERQTMTSLKILGLATALSIMATHAFAQEAISEPGAFAFYHPNADVLNGGRRPAEGALAAVPYGTPYAATGSVPGPRLHRAPAHPRSHVSRQ